MAPFLKDRSIHPLVAPLLVSSLAFAAGCGDTANDGGELRVPSRYEFPSRVEGEDSVSYAGQTFRQVLIKSMKREIATIQEEIDNDGAVFSAGEVRARLNLYYTFDSDSAGQLGHGVVTDPAPAQISFDDISSGKDLRGKIAGQDPTGQHVDWNAAGVVGWGVAVAPDALVAQWMDELDALAVAFSTGTIPTDPDGAAIPVWYVDANGRDYQQLMEKFLLGAVNFSQAADDYLDDDIEGKGLRADNSAVEEEAPYTALEHAWDEGFGYWGGARDYLAYDDADMADSPAHDHDGNGAIDLLSEYSFGAAQNASKRDLGASETAPTDFSGDTMTAFLTGRAIIAAANGDLSDADLAALQRQRDAAIEGWEKALAATAVHYINDTLRDLNDDAVGFDTLAKHWSELKGFALALQFNPRMTLTDEQFAALHTWIGDAPGIDASYQTNLLEARSVLAEAYNFDAANIGDDLGEDGW